MRVNGADSEALRRIQQALEQAAGIFRDFTPGKVKVRTKGSGDPVTEADHRVNLRLHEVLPAHEDGWLSEETVDDLSRLKRRRVWVVDPLDGTREFVSGIPEWCVSVALVEDGLPIAGGIFNPATHEMFLGARQSGVTYNGKPAKLTSRETLEGALVLASRSEVDRGEWNLFSHACFKVRPVGSVAYKLALVAAGLADATWTVVPKHEWDVAAGVALILAGGGRVYSPDGVLPRFNRRKPLLSGLAAHPPALMAEVKEQLALATRPEAKGDTGGAGTHF